VFQTILVAFDGSPGSLRALHRAVILAREHGAALHALSVEEPVPHYLSAADEARAEAHAVAAFFKRLQAVARHEAASQGVAIQIETVRGHAARAIVDYAHQIGADLIVIGQHSQPGLIEWMLGSTSDRVVDTADCSVLVVRGEPTEGCWSAPVAGPA